LITHSAFGIVLEKDITLMTKERSDVSEAEIKVTSIEIFDQVKALELMEGDVDLLRELVSLFKSERIELMGQLKSAIVSGDCDSVRMAAHRLKGASASVGGERTAAIARVLEAMGAAGTLNNAEGFLVQLQTSLGEYDQATDFLGRES
jgi:HPt (histidine-containing phosphotransfer) domain-containing protein